MDGFNTNPSITLKSTSSEYFVNFDGKTIETILTDEASIADRWVHEILSVYAGKPTVVGLDVEWGTQSMTQKPATLQLCVDGKCLILQLVYMDKIPQSLRSFLSDSNFTFVGVEVRNEIAKLKNGYGLKCACSADIRELTIQRWPGRFGWPGLKQLAWEVADLEMPKPKHGSNWDWEARVLDENQVEYACIDAYASYKIGHKLMRESCRKARACVTFPALARDLCLCIGREPNMTLRIEMG